MGELIDMMERLARKHADEALDRVNEDLGLILGDCDVVIMGKDEEVKDFWEKIRDADKDKKDREGKV
jgi:hypothetical protein